ncbi:hypothetical protein [Nonomuraea jabiensis]|uniref:hypothetical protein n=1 Tax=Nonomuraea jabiensis TaxID=882448 RepID=UPI003D714743
MALSPEQRKKRGQLAARKRWNPDAPETVDAQRDFRVERAENYIRRLVDEAPPLTAEQRDRLALLLRGGHTAGGTADAA